MLCQISLRLGLQLNKLVGPPYSRAEMYAGRVACCPLVSHVHNAPPALLRLEKKLCIVIVG